MRVCVFGSKKCRRPICDRAKFAAVSVTGILTKYIVNLQHCFQKKEPPDDDDIDVDIAHIFSFLALKRSDKVQPLNSPRWVDELARSATTFVRCPLTHQDNRRFCGHANPFTRQQHIMYNKGRRTSSDREVYGSDRLPSASLHYYTALSFMQIALIPANVIYRYLTAALNFRI